MIFLAAWLPLWGQLLLGALVLGVWLLLRHSRRTFAYWKNKGVPTYGNPVPFLGTTWSVFTFREHSIHFLQRAYTYGAKNGTYIGFYTTYKPGLMICDPELAKNILVKDFAHFVDHGLKMDEEVDPLQAKNLFNMNGNKWRAMRAKLTPTFTSGRIKAMLPLMLEVAEKLDLHLAKMADSGENFEAKELISQYATDVIGSCAFGIQCNSLENPNNEFRKMSRKLIDIDFVKFLRFFSVIFLPKVAKFFRLAILTEETSQFFRKMVQDVVALRSSTGEIRRDFIQLMIELKEKDSITPEMNKKSDSDQLPENNSTENDTPSTNLKITDDDITAQALVFFAAGFDNSSAVLSFALLELSRKPHLQSRARKEIKLVIQKHGNEMNYEALQDMHFLDAILKESLRMYPPVHHLMRVCTKNYVLPGSEIVIEEGTSLIIPTHAMQNDPTFFPEPDTFNPDRFLGDQKYSPYVYMPFGEGPRQCIGNRFALLQSKVCLATLLRSFEVRPCEKSVYPPKLSLSQCTLAVKDGVWLRLLRATDEQGTEE